ncbi:MAG: hypothetical protein R3C25_13980 [Hyphomonadaceae bacterium]
MSNGYQMLAFDALVSNDASVTSQLAVDWMISGGFVSEHVSDCVGGADVLGRAPGPNWCLIVDEARR